MYLIKIRKWYTYIMRKLKLLLAIFIIFVLTIFLFHNFSANAYMVGPSLTFEKIAEESDVIFKAKIMSSSLIENNWFEGYGGYSSNGTEMKIISIIKGEIPNKTVFFQHYSESKDEPYRRMNSPQFYNFEIGKSYIVFAKKTDSEGVYRQLWKDHKSKMDQGVFLTSDEEEVDIKFSVKEIIWNEFKKHLKSSDSKNVIYAIKQMDLMSRNSGWDKLDDYDRELVMEQIHGFVLSSDEEISKVAINAIGWLSPYFSDGYAKGWIATIGEGKIHGYAQWDKDRDNKFARKYWKELVEVVNGNGSRENRALAIRSLGLSLEPKVFSYAIAWTKMDEPMIKQAAIILLADYPREETYKIFKESYQDDYTKVRLGVARAIGFGQFDELISILDELIIDDDTYVANAAYVSLLSFDGRKVKSIFEKYKDHPDWKVLFVNALADINPEPYIDELAEIIEKDMESKYFKGGTIPSFLSWKILFTYIQKQDREKIKEGDFNRHFDALEVGKVHSSSMPRDLYAFYIHHGLRERANIFRERCKAAISHDMEYFFDMVDKQEDYFIRNMIYSNYGLTLDDVQKISN